MYFIRRGGGIINKNDENIYRLRDALHDGNILRIKRLSEFNESEIINRCKLEYGIKMSDDGLVEPHGKAFTFNKQNNIIELFKDNADIYISPKLPWSSLSADFNVSHKASTKKTNYSETSMSFDVNLQGRAKIIMTDKVRPSQEFENEVNAALNCANNPIEELRKVCNKYGEFWAREIILGGKIQIVQDDFVEI
ncbi:3757_t:CDS:2, partial [Racocetra fulgida]